MTDRARRPGSGNRDDARRAAAGARPGGDAASDEAASTPRAEKPRAGDAPDVRAEAARALLAVIDRRQSLDRVLPDADARLPDARDRALLRALLFATLRSIYRLRAVADAMLATPMKPRDRVVYALVLVGFAQLSHGITPAYAAVAGTAEAARALGRPTFVNLVNALMRRFQREGAEMLARLPAHDVALAHDHPAWLVERLARDWPEAWRDVLHANNRAASVWLRVNRRRHDAATYRALLEADGIAARPHPLLPDALELDASVDVASLPGFGSGAVSIQDGAAQLAAELLAPAAGLRVLDACAAPGGKAAHLLEREPGLRVTALEPYSNRVARLRETLARLGLEADVREGDATRPETWWDGTPYDRILIDAPCSGTGVIRRHPDIRLLRRGGDLAAQCALQARLLDAAWRMLARGGRLVYATCSVLPDENAQQIAAFLARTPDARALDAVPAAFGRAAGAGRQNLPGEQGMDGFYYAVLEKGAAAA